MIVLVVLLTILPYSKGGTAYTEPTLGCPIFPKVRFMKTIYVSLLGNKKEGIIAAT
jgi:hypothetical protein